MDMSESPLKKAALKVSAWMFISWILIVGPVGLALLCGLAYAMYFANLALGVVCILLMFLPLLFVAVWAPLMGATFIVDRSAERAEPAAEVNQVL
jgi:hypothetical protein